jgi:hypothetical protein
MPLTTTRALTTLLLTTTLLSAPGCVSRFLTDDDQVQREVDQAPPVALRANQTHHMLVFQAPNPGWTIRLDETDRTPEGKRVFVTIRRPDPLLQYTQQIVTKRLLTQVELETPIEIYARVLDANERAKKQPYAPLTPTPSADPID